VVGVGVNVFVAVGVKVLVCVDVDVDVTVTVDVKVGSGVDVGFNVDVGWAILVSKTCSVPSKSTRLVAVGGILTSTVNGNEHAVIAIIKNNVTIRNLIFPFTTHLHSQELT
jgi:hypothetical protein